VEDTKNPNFAKLLIHIRIQRLNSLFCISQVPSKCTWSLLSLLDNWWYSIQQGHKISLLLLQDNIRILLVIDTNYSSTTLLNRQRRFCTCIVIMTLTSQDCSESPCAPMFLLLTVWSHPSRRHTVLRVEPHTHGNWHTAQWAC